MLAWVCDDRRLIAVAAKSLGMLALIAGDLDGAGLYLEESRGPGHTRRATAGRRPWPRRRRGRPGARMICPEQRPAAKEASLRFKTQGDAWGQAFALLGPGPVAEAGDDYASATHHWRERLALSRAPRNLGAPPTLDYLGALALLQGRFRGRRLPGGETRPAPGAGRSAAIAWTSTPWAT